VKATAYPLTLDRELTAIIKQTAAKTGLSMADIMRRSIKLGLPQLTDVGAVKAGRVTAVDPLPSEEWRRCYAEPDDDGELIRARMAAQVRRVAE